MSDAEHERAQRRPLTGVRVLDLTRGMSGALVGMLLADYGAEVVMAESPRGVPLRDTGGHSVWNRGKRSIVVDLDRPDDVATLLDLAAGADVVIEDRRPGALAQLGLGSADVLAVNDDVVYCSISAYGQHGSRRDRVGFDASVAAHLGIMVEWGGTREGPIFLGHPALDYSTAFLATTGILSCLRSRIVSGHGDSLDVSLLDGALSLYPMNWWTEQGSGSIDVKSSTGDLRFGHKRLLLRMFECSDGRLVQVHTGAAGAFDRAMEVFGLGDVVSKMEGNVQMSSLLTDNDLDVIQRRLPDIMRSRPRQEWLELLWQHQVAALPVGEPGEALDDEQVRYAGIVATLDDPALGPIEVVGPTVLLSESPGSIASPAPELDADGTALRSAGWTSAGLAVTPKGAALATPLAGVQIVEFATFFAAPYADRLLSDLGADVIKIEGLDGDPMRPLPEMFEGANRGKRSISVNLKHPLAKDLVRDLVRSADVVQHNLRPGVAERLGIDDASIRAVSPDVIYHYSPGYGSSGPKSGLQSFAPLLSGFVGQFAIGAGAGNRPHATFGNEDYYNGLLGSCACLLALIHRERTGVGQVVESPQLHSSVFTTSEYYKRNGEIASVIPRLSGDLTGWTAGYRIYQCLDAWICVTCVQDEQMVALAAAVVPAAALAELDDAARRPDASVSGPLATLLEYHFVERTTSEWIDILGAAGVPAEIVEETSWLANGSFHDEELLAGGRMIEVDHPVHGRTRMVGDLIHPARQRTGHRGRAPMHSEHTMEVLAELGYDDARIAELVEQSVVRSAVAGVESLVGKGA